MVGRNNAHATVVLFAVAVCYAGGARGRGTTGHNWGVKNCEWHPTKSLIASGSKDCMVKLWDPRSGDCLSTLHGHKGPVQVTRWSPNGNWLLSTSKDKVSIHAVHTCMVVHHDSHPPCMCTVCTCMAVSPFTCSIFEH